MYCRSFLGSHLLAVVHLGEAAESVPLGVAELGVAVEGDLGVERVHFTGRLEDQRVDLGEVAVALGVAAVQLDEDVGAPSIARSGAWRIDAAGGRGLGRPSTGSMWILTIASGFSSATTRSRRHLRETAS